jgi:hypothetical protein
MTTGAAIRLSYLAGACAIGFAVAPARAQQDVSPPPPIDVNTPPLIIEPLPQPRSPVRSSGTGKKRGADSDAAKVGRDIDAASRRVQSDRIGNEIEVRDDAVDRDRVRTERARATSQDPHEAARLRQEYNQRLAEHERWRDDKQRQRQDLEPPPPADDDR